MAQPPADRLPPAADACVAGVMTRDAELHTWLGGAVSALSFRRLDPGIPPLEEVRRLNVIFLDDACLDGASAIGSVLRQLRSVRPLIVLLRGRDRRQVATVLEAGADDAMCQPFFPDELRARVLSLARRSPRGRPLGTGGVSYDRVRRELLHTDGTSRRLTPSECVVLETLLDADGGTVSRESLLRRMAQHPMDVKSNVVDRHIATLRMKLREDPHAASCIATVTGSGYRLVGGTHQSASAAAGF